MINATDIKLLTTMLRMDPPRHANQLQTAVSGYIPLSTIHSALRKLVHEKMIREKKAKLRVGLSRLEYEVSPKGIATLRKVRDSINKALGTESDDAANLDQ